MVRAKRKTLPPCLLWRREGFTLTEILVSISLIVVGVLGFSASTITVIQAHSASSNITIATHLAQDKLEELKSQGTWANITNSSDPNNPTTATGARGGIFTRTWSVSDSPLGTGLKQLTVTVSWRDYLMERRVTCSTLVFTG